jgi:cell division protein FtsL
MEQLLLIYKDDERYQRMGQVKETQDKIDDAKSKIKEIDRQLADL